jgi:hypothetical protein
MAKQKKEFILPPPKFAVGDMVVWLDKAWTVTRLIERPMVWAYDLKRGENSGVVEEHNIKNIKL